MIGKRAAMMAKINAEAPQIAMMLANIGRTLNNTDSIRRAEDGALYVVENLLLLPADYDHPSILARVAHPDKPREYTIKDTSYGGSLYRCSCPDWQNGYHRSTMNEDNPDRPLRGAPHITKVGWMCKHTWAYHLNHVANRPLNQNNPNATILGEKLYQLICDTLQMRDAEVFEVVKDSQPIGLSQGYFHLYIDHHDIHAEQKQYLESAVLEATAKSIQLVTHK